MFTNRINRHFINAAKQEVLDFLNTSMSVLAWDNDDFNATFTGDPLQILFSATDSAEKVWSSLFQKADTDAKAVAMASVLRSMTAIRNDKGLFVDFVPISNDVINAVIGDLKRGLAMIYIDDNDAQWNDFMFRVRG